MCNCHLTSVQKWLRGGERGVTIYRQSEIACILWSNGGCREEKNELRSQPTFPRILEGVQELKNGMSNELFLMILFSFYFNFYFFLFSSHALEIRINLKKENSKKLTLSSFVVHKFNKTKISQLPPAWDRTAWTNNTVTVNRYKGGKQMSPSCSEWHQCERSCRLHLKCINRPKDIV